MIAPTGWKERNEMKRERHKIGELRRVVKLCGGSVVHTACPNQWPMSVSWNDPGEKLLDHADHIICHVRDRLWDVLVDIHRSPSGFSWVQYDSYGTIIRYSTEYVPTLAAAMIDALEATNE